MSCFPSLLEDLNRASLSLDQAKARLSNALRDKAGEPAVASLRSELDACKAVFMECARQCLEQVGDDEHDVQLAEALQMTNTPAEPGTRSGEGAQSLLHHLGIDSRAKTAGELAHPDVAIALERWEAVHDTLREMEGTLADAVRAYAEGTGPLPTVLVAEVTQLRALCSGHFSVLLESVKAQIPKG